MSGQRRPDALIGPYLSGEWGCWRAPEASGVTRAGGGQVALLCSENYELANEVKTVKIGI